VGLYRAENTTCVSVMKVGRLMLEETVAVLVRREDKRALWARK
jgi:hypothetical protein